MKNFFRKIINALRNSYGIDNLYFVLFGVATALLILNLFLHSWIVWIIEVAVIGYMIFRTFSTKKAKRAAENDAFFGFIRKIGGFFKFQKRRFQDRKQYIYKKCPKCRAVLRLRREKGKHTAVCPACHNRFEVKVKRNKPIF